MEACSLEIGNAAEGAHSGPLKRIGSLFLDELSFGSQPQELSAEVWDKDEGDEDRTFEFINMESRVAQW